MVSKEEKEKIREFCLEGKFHSILEIHNVDEKLYTIADIYKIRGAVLNKEEKDNLRKKKVVINDSEYQSKNVINKILQLDFEQAILYLLKLNVSSHYLTYFVEHNKKYNNEEQKYLKSIIGEYRRRVKKIIFTQNMTKRIKENNKDINTIVENLLDIASNEGEVTMKGGVQRKFDSIDYFMIAKIFPHEFLKLIKESYPPETLKKINCLITKFKNYIKITEVSIRKEHYIVTIGDKTKEITDELNNEILMYIKEKDLPMISIIYNDLIKRVVKYASLKDSEIDLEKSKRRIKTKISIDNN